VDGLRLVQLRTGSVQHDRGQADLLQERQRGHQSIQVVTQHRTTDLDHGKALGIELREPFQVLLDLLGAAHAREQSDDGLSGAVMRVHGR
jgi:hypothetical protein